MANRKPVQNNPLLWRSCGERAGCLESQGLSEREMWKIPLALVSNVPRGTPRIGKRQFSKCSTWNIVRLESRAGFDLISDPEHTFA
jgi:hypothetical protein